MNNVIRKVIEISDFKVKSETERTFTIYGNVKHNIDHAGDRTMSGAYSKSISNHKENGTRPKMFWNHDHFNPPVGKWPHMEEDTKGLLYEGKVFKGTERSNEIWTGMLEEEIDSASIGYIVVQEKRNTSEQCNDLIELDIKETSLVNFACNELSTLQSIQKSLGDGEILSKADLRHLLEFSAVGLSKRQIDAITGRYSCESKEQKQINEIGALLAKSTMFN